MPALLKERISIRSAPPSQSTVCLIRLCFPSPIVFQLRQCKLKTCPSLFSQVFRKRDSFPLENRHSLTGGRNISDYRVTKFCHVVLAESERIFPEPIHSSDQAVVAHPQRYTGCQKCQANPSFSSNLLRAVACGRHYKTPPGRGRRPPAYPIFFCFQSATILNSQEIPMF
jgi:hypothetical protein